ncbi:MAG TPA: hypothetical protein VKT32_01725 [Chthonomonadaceae bacterium]|nr:hypothetical protein [Chthonomonadaceae bacterium]
MTPYRRMTALWISLLVWGLLVWGGLARATPFFSRTYHFPCVTCHSGFPRLNAFGLAFKANDFRIPGAEKTAPLAWQKTIPLAMQIMPTSEVFGPGTVQAPFTDSQILAGGLLTRSTAFYVHHSEWIDAKPLEFPSYEVWVQQVLSERQKIMLKAGQFELPFAYSPGINRTTVFTPLIFGVGLQGNDPRLGSAVRGLQLSGRAPRLLRWYVASGAPSVLTPGNTNGHREFFGEFPDVFLRVCTPDLEREIGLFTYLTQSPRNPADTSAEQHGQRYGLDARWLWRGNQVFGTFVYGEDSDPTGKGKKGVLRGGFIEVDRQIQPWWGLAARWETQSSNNGAGRVYSDARTLSLRVYMSQNVKLIGEYQSLAHHRYATALAAAITF